jgi:dynein heavy chain
MTRLIIIFYNLIGAALVEPTTMEPVDTMNLAAMSLPPMKKEEEKEEVEEKVEPTEVKLMLFPSQIHKLSCLLSLLAHLRDLVEGLLVMESPSPIQSLDWKSQLQYRFAKENRGVSVKVTENFLKVFFKAEL